MKAACGNMAQIKNMQAVAYHKYFCTQQTRKLCYITLASQQTKVSADEESTGNTHGNREHSMVLYNTGITTDPALVSANEESTGKWRYKDQSAELWF
eukprot:1112438-Pelagomonas_calceolata.AAC.1